jgi:hypothetical protein
MLAHRAYDGVVRGLRIVHIVKSPEGLSGASRFDIFDTGKNGSESGAAETTCSLSLDGVRHWLAKEGLPYARLDAAINELKQLNEGGVSEVEIPPPAGPRIVRAWFDTVFNPLISALDFERGLLVKRNWTFSYAPPRLAAIRPANRYLREEDEANLEQVLQLNLTLAESVHTHDTDVGELLRSVSALHAALLESRDFIDLCQSMMTPEKLLEIGVLDAREIFGAYAASDRLKLIAQNVVNGAGELPSHYPTARFWSWNRGRLLETLGLPGVREHHAKVLQVAEKIAGETKALADQMRKLRLDLSLMHDVPYAAEDRSRLTA